MQEPVEYRRDDSLFTDEFAPALGSLVRCQDNRASFVQLVDQMEQEVGLPLFHGHIHHVIENDQVRLDESFVAHLGTADDVARLHGVQRLAHRHEAHLAATLDRVDT